MNTPQRQPGKDATARSHAAAPSVPRQPLPPPPRRTPSQADRATRAAFSVAPFEPHHQDGVVAAIRHVYEEYGFTWEADGYNADIYDVQVNYIATGGCFRVALDTSRVIGTCGMTRHGDECELHRMYLMSDYRGFGLGRALLDSVTDWAVAENFRRIVLWSDVILTTAHVLYESAGFIREGHRICNDPDHSPEHGYYKMLR